VHFQRTLPNNLIHLPVNTLLFRAQGLQVATLNKNNQVVLKSVTISRDFGKTVEIKQGLRVGERVILNPSDSIFDGQKVQVMEKPSSQQPP